MSDWQPIETAPKDGGMFLSRDADHPDWGVSATIRWIERKWCDDYGEMRTIDMGAWLYAHGHAEGDYIEGECHFPFAVAHDKYNATVKREWMPVPNN